MALKVIENFYDWSSSDLDQEGVQTSAGVSVHTDVAPRSACGSIRLSVNTEWVQWPIPADATIRFSMRVRREASAFDYVLLSPIEGASTHVQVGVNGSGYLFAKLQFSTIGTATIDPIPVDTWTHIEGKIVVHDTTGSVEVRVNGSATPALLLTGIDTRVGGAAGTPDAVRIGGVGNDSVAAYYTDFAVWDEAGETPTGWIGDCRVDTYLPTGAGSSTEWTPSAGANYAAADDPDGDTSYVESSTTGDLDLYAMGNMAHTPATIYAVAVTTLARKTDSGTGSVKLTMKSGATQAQSTDQGLSDADYARKLYARGVDPGTSSAWTQSGVNGLEAGVESVL